MQFTEHENKIIIKVPVSAEAITTESITQALQTFGYERCFVLQAQLDNLLVEYQQLQQKVKNLVLAENSQILTYPIAERRAALLQLDIAENNMSASAIITTAWGGTHISANMLVKAAQDAGIVFGFHKENIIRLIQQASRVEPGIRLKATIANGREVMHGLHSRFVPLLPEMVKRHKRPLIESNGKADLRDFGAIPSVIIGQGVMQRIPPTMGEPGITVTGVQTPPLPGVNIEWQLGAGVKVSDSDADLLVATEDGLPRVVENGAAVDEVYTVNQVDLASGHITFKGSVVVNGNVATGMKVVAGGDIFIKGVMEGSLAEAGGDITIYGAIIGHQINGSAHEFSTFINAGGAIHCNMAQYSAFQCQGTLYASKYLMHCEAEATAVRLGTEESITGKIVGGHYFLSEHLSCAQLGSPSSGVVVIKLNRKLEPVMQQQELLRNQITQIKVRLAESKALLEQHLKLIGNQPDEQSHAMELAFEELKHELRQLVTTLRELESERLHILSNLSVTVTEKLFSAVEIQFGVESIRTRREYSPSRVHIIDGHPAIEPI